MADFEFVRDFEAADDLAGDDRALVRMLPSQVAPTARLKSPSSSPSPWTAPEMTNGPKPRMLPTNTVPAPITVGVDAARSRKRLLTGGAEVAGAAEAAGGFGLSSFIGDFLPYSGPGMM
jgi:hypothetical protein